MSDVTFRSDMTVEVVDSMGDEQSIVRAARVSTLGAQAEATEAAGLVRFLMREGHGTPFESPVLTLRIEAPVFVTRQILKHRMCLSGKTRVRRAYRDGTAYGNVNNTIEKMWELWHVGAKRRHLSGKEFYAPLPNRKEMWVVSANEEDHSPHISKVLDIVKNGVRETWEVTTRSGRKIRASKDHKFFTPKGWKRLHELEEGDFVYREGRVAINPVRQIPPRLREGIGHWTQQQRAELIPHDGAACYLCGAHRPFEGLELDHVIAVSEDLERALQKANLKPACAECHREKSRGEQGRNVRMGSKMGLRTDRIVSISDPQEEETYDLVLEDPWHNFIAEGIVVHNSSINEESGRYRELEPVFYAPGTDRPVVQVGKTGAYEFKNDGPTNQEAWIRIRQSSMDAWDAYQEMLSAGIAKEVARMVLPVNIYSTMYVTMNLRSWLNFVSLRTLRYGSKPQYEIAEVGEKVRDILVDRFPTVMDQFEKESKV